MRRPAPRSSDRLRREPRTSRLRATCLGARPGGHIAEGAHEIARGAGSVRVLGLPLIAELRDGSLLAGGDEDRVVAEALAPPRVFGDPSFQDAGSAGFLAGRRERDQLADVAGSTVFAFDTAELRQEALDRI